ncbi:DNA-3-methyladenine glycosylase I [Catenulispora sp. EB89]|uniref:DNA-3-methyladenine glycosylase I n=1 Tax=Catenulispora sp. EB89 TaxID=3156257 RepID=UPI003516CEEF
MSEDVITGPDGVTRCAWAGGGDGDGNGDTAMSAYHDAVWGTPTVAPTALFEALTLGVFEVGMSWKVVFGKREGLRRAFRDFDAAAVAKMTGRDVDRLVGDASIIRSRAKIQATLDNARAMVSASPTLGELVQTYARQRRRAPRMLADVPTSTPDSEAFALVLKGQGYRFVGPTSVYAFMQNVGAVNDHVKGCFRAAGAG